MSPNLLSITSLLTSHHNVFSVVVFSSFCITGLTPPFSWVLIFYLKRVRDYNFTNIFVMVCRWLLKFIIINHVHYPQDQSFLNSHETSPVKELGTNSPKRGFGSPKLNIGSRSPKVRAATARRTNKRILPCMLHYWAFQNSTALHT